MDIKEAKDLARQAKVDIEAILDDLYNQTGISITDMVIHRYDVTNVELHSREIKYWVTLSASVVI